jgi:hypothetical protein
MSASHWNLDNPIAIVDVSNQQSAISSRPVIQAQSWLSNPSFIGGRRSAGPRNVSTATTWTPWQKTSTLHAAIQVHTPE